MRGQRGLVVERAAKFLEAESDGAEGGGAFGGQRRQRGAVQAGGEKDADGNVGDEVVADAVAKGS